MMLTEETSFADAALPLAEFKSHLTIGTGFADTGTQDMTLLSYLRAAVAAIEGRTGKVLIDRAYAWTVHEWANDGGEIFPVAPALAVTEMVRTDVDGVNATLPVMDVRIEADMHRPVLRPRGYSLPAVPTGGSITVKFTAGMAANWGGLPSDLAHAIILLAAHYYEYRDDTALSDGCMPFGVSSLVQRYRPLRLTMGAGS